MKDYFVNYLDHFKQVVNSISVEHVCEIQQLIRKAIEEERQIFVFGNGGSAMSTSHFATDMLKGAGDALKKRVKIVALNDNAGLLTALGNDYSFDDVFCHQLKTLANPGDIVLTLSVSGSSPNLVKAFEWAKTNKLKSIALVGGKKGLLSEIADNTLVIDSLHYGHVEDAHMIMCHMIAFSFIENPNQF
ncbi:SIS domain-containing protein [Maribacter arcticus]|uniref:SIS domain-containing protein n=1 Tax=Maribacter arcticus TaxID=561365 RepID=UPI0030014565